MGQIFGHLQVMVKKFGFHPKFLGISSQGSKRPLGLILSARLKIILLLFIHAPSFASQLD